MGIEIWYVCAHQPIVIFRRNEYKKAKNSKLINPLFQRCFFQNPDSFKVVRTLFADGQIEAW